MLRPIIRRRRYLAWPKIFTVTLLFVRHSNVVALITIDSSLLPETTNRSLLRMADAYFSMQSVLDARDREVRSRSKPD